MRNIAFITTTRADYGLQKPLIKKFLSDNSFKTTLIVSGTHLSDHYGKSVSEIEKDGIPIDHRIEVISNDHFSNPLTFSSKILEKVGGVLEQIRPDLLFILGDRYEILVCGFAASMLNIPIAHMAGGDVTLGAYDDAFRHALTKLSHLHFPTNEGSRRRIIQMGEQPDRVLNFGHLGIDVIKGTQLLDKNELMKELGIKFTSKNIVITYHPVTNAQYKNGYAELFSSVEDLPSDVTLFFTAPNADHQREEIKSAIEDIKLRRKNVYLFESLGSVRYLSLLKHSDLCLGNSSSGIYESPYIGTPVVNIGNRQKGRPLSELIVQCEEDAKSISEAISKALTLKGTSVTNPYGKGNTADLIHGFIKSIPDLKSLLDKKFNEHAI